MARRETMVRDTSCWSRKGCSASTTLGGMKVTFLVLMATSFLLLVIHDGTGYGEGSREEEKREGKAGLRGDDGRKKEEEGQDA